jgi:hypothetical protein
VFAWACKRACALHPRRHRSRPSGGEPQDPQSLADGAASSAGARFPANQPDAARHGGVTAPRTAPTPRLWPTPQWSCGCLCAEQEYERAACVRHSRSRLDRPRRPSARTATAAADERHPAPRGNRAPAVRRRPAAAAPCMHVSRPPPAACEATAGRVARMGGCCQPARPGRRRVLCWRWMVAEACARGTPGSSAARCNTAHGAERRGSARALCRPGPMSTPGMCLARARLILRPSAATSTPCSA